MKKKIALLGAFDRNNYGDVLMPIVFKKIMGNDLFEYEQFGVVSNDLSYCGGLTCKSIVELYRNYDNYDSIVLVGGECIGSDYSTMYLSVVDTDEAERRLTRLSKVFPRIFNAYSKKKLQGVTPKPWIIKCDNRKKIIYNTVGGHLNRHKIFFLNKISKKDLNICRESMSFSDYVSLRDERSYEYMNFIPNRKKYPDTITILSELYGDLWFEKHIQNNELINSIKNKYIVFQMNEVIGNKIIKDVIIELKKFSKETGYKIFLLPLGYAHAHNDFKILRRVYQKCRDICIMFEFLNIYESMYIIKNADAYVGTSLHGAITSISYGVPHMALTKKSKKLIRYLNTWNTTKYVFSNTENLSKSLKYLIEDIDNKKILNQKKLELIELVKENNKKILEVLLKND